MATGAKHLFGRLVRLSNVGKTVTNVTLPEDSEAVFVSNDDLTYKTFEYFDSFIPVFYDNVVAFDQQIGLAVFESKYEDAELLANEVVFEYASSVDSVAAMDAVDSLSFVNGRTALFFRKPDNITTTTFVVKRHCGIPLNDLRVKAWESGGKMHIETSTQWPTQLKACVEKETTMEVVLHSVAYHDVFDEYMDQTIQAAIITAVAAKKSDAVCELVFTPRVWHPRVEINITSTVNKAKNCTALKIGATVDMGAFPVITKEYLRSLIAGLVPVYKLSAIEINAKVIKSNNHNACFYSDLGYSTGLAAIEDHFSQVCRKYGILPTLWRKQNILKTAISDSVRRSGQFGSLKQTVINCMEDSWFDRQYSINSQAKLSGNGVNPFIRYSRGIGIACGEGVQGFTSQFETKNAVKVTLLKDNKVAISCGMIPGSFMQNLLTEIATKTLKLDIPDVTFDDSLESGPSVLARTIKNTPDLVEKCCKVLVRRKTRPTSITISDVADKSDAYYKSDTFGTLAIALHIDSVMLIPVIDNVWVNVKFGKVYDLTRLRRMIRRVIASSISEVCPCAEHKFDISLNIESDDNFAAGSASSLIRGLTLAAFSSAFSQALGHNVAKLPVNSKDVLGILEAAGETHES